MSVNFGPSNNNPKNVWLTIDESGKVTYIDWDKVDYYAEAFNNGLRSDTTFYAFICRAVREHMLEKIPATITFIKEDKNGG